MLVIDNFNKREMQFEIYDLLTSINKKMPILYAGKSNIVYK